MARVMIQELKQLADKTFVLETEKCSGNSIDFISEIYHSQIDLPVFVSTHYLVIRFKASFFRLSFCEQNLKLL